MKIRTLALSVAAACVVAYVTVVATVYLKQDRLMFRPNLAHITPADAGLNDVQVLALPTPDGETLNAWYTPARESQPTILFFHGRSGNIGDRTERYKAYTDAGFGVLFIDYRGYGNSTGTPSEEGLVTDAHTGYDWLIGQGIAAQDIALVGESLGTGIAVKLAAKRDVAAIALEAPYSSFADIAAEQYWWLPARLLIKNPIDALADIGKVKVPLLIHHGDADDIIPIKFGRRLFEAAHDPKTFVVVPGADHFIFNNKTFAAEMKFLREVFKRPQ